MGYLGRSFYSFSLVKEALYLFLMSQPIKVKAKQQRTGCAARNLEHVNLSGEIVMHNECATRSQFVFVSLTLNSRIF